MTRSEKLKISQPRFDAEGLPDPLAGDKRCLQINREWIPLIIGCLDWMNGNYAWNGTQAEIDTAVQYVRALIDHLATGVADGCEGEILESACCTEYPANHPVIQYAPNDPFQTPNLTPPGGYYTPPWKEFSALAELIPNTEEGDAIVPITAFPFGAAEPFNPENILELIAVAGFPRFKFRFTGSGTIELHLLKFPLGGFCYISVDSNPLTGKTVSTESLDLDEVIPLLVGLGILPILAVAHVIQDEIVEIEIEDGGEHYIDCTFLPKLEFIGPLPYMVGFGGGLRKIVLCGDIQAEEIPPMQMQMDGCEIQWRPNDNTEWETLGSVLSGITVSAETLAAGQSATVEISDCEIIFGIPTGPQGEQGIQGIQGVPGQDGADGADGQDGENAPIPLYDFSELGNSVYLKIDTDASGTWDHTSPNLRGADGENAPIPLYDFSELGNSVYLKIDTDASGTWDHTSPNLRGADGSDGADGDSLSCDWQYEQPTDLTYLCRAARVASDLFIADTLEAITAILGDIVTESLIVGDLFMGGLPPSMIKASSGLIPRVPDGVPFILFIPDVETDHIDWLLTVYNDVERLALIEMYLKCRLVTAWTADPTLGDFIAYGNAYPQPPDTALEDLLLDAYNLQANETISNAKLVDFFYNIVALAFHYSPDSQKLAVYFEANLSCTTGIEDCECDEVPTEWCHEFDFLTNDGNWNPIETNYSAFTSEGWGQGDENSRMGIMYHFPSPVDSAISITFELDNPLGGDTGKMIAEFNNATYQLSNYQAISNILEWQIPTLSGGLNNIYTDFVKDINSGTGDPITAHIIKITIRGIGDNPFGSSNC